MAQQEIPIEYITTLGEHKERNLILTCLINDRDEHFIESLIKDVADAKWFSKLQTHFELVKEFNITSGASRDISYELAKFRMSLIVEELNELQEAMDDHNRNEIIDALADILYVCYGLCDVFNYDIDRQFIAGNGYDVKSIPDAPIYHMLMKHRDILLELMTIPDMEYLQRIMFKCIENIVQMCYTFSHMQGINIWRALYIVHRSNMSKFCKTEQEAIDTVEWYKANNTTYDSPAYKKVGSMWVVYNQSTGKTLKNINYVPAKFD